MSVPIVFWFVAFLTLNSISAKSATNLSNLRMRDQLNLETNNNTASESQALSSRSDVLEVRRGVVFGIAIFAGATTILLLLILSLYILKRVGRSKTGLVNVNFQYDRQQNELPEGGFKIDKTTKLGEGSFGTVYKGTLKVNDGGDEMPVAFKSTTLNSKFTDLETIFQEIRILGHVGEHENVVRFYGACTSESAQGIIYVALEFCELGSLDRYLRILNSNALQKAAAEVAIAQKNSPNSSNYQSQEMLFESSDLTLQAAFAPGTEALSRDEFQVDTALRWAYETARGMDHLNSRNVIHADLATRNLLLTANKTIKITDFGLSKKIYATIDNTRTFTFDKNQRLPWKWLAPESLECQSFSTKSDVWSYGIVLWEIFSLGQSPYKDCEKPNVLLQSFKANYRLGQPSLCPQETYDLMSKCWKYEPVERPTFTDIKRTLSPQKENYVVIGIEN